MDQSVKTLHKRNSLGYVIGRKTPSSGPEIVWGRSSDGSRVHIDDAHSGAVDMIRCDCGEFLIAKKGDQLAHHFAHAYGSRKKCGEAHIYAVANFAAEAMVQGKTRLPILDNEFRYVVFSQVCPEIYRQNILVRCQLLGKKNRSVSVFVQMTPRQTIPDTGEAEARGESAFVIDLSKFRNATDELLRAAILRLADRTWIYNQVRPDAVREETLWRKGIPSRIRMQLPSRLAPSPQTSDSRKYKSSLLKSLISETEWNTLPPSELRRRLFGDKYER